MKKNKKKEHEEKKNKDEKESHKRQVGMQRCVLKHRQGTQ